METTIKPFIKWAGGKTQLLEILKENFPPKEIRINRYIETFIGGGALFLDILSNFNNYNFDEIIINDINTKLIDTYICLKEDYKQLVKHLNELKTTYQSFETLEEKETFFYEVRNNFNDKTNTDKYKKSAELIFLNKTCFNGLYRENSKGLFNVPFGKHKEPSIFDENHLKHISNLLNLKNSSGNDVVKILNLHFDELAIYIDQNTFVYFDPPYRPVTKNGFTSYDKSNFNDEAQILLAEFCKKISTKKAYFLLSNSDPKNLDENDNFFDDLYKDFSINRVSASRRINSKGNGRGNITEILVNNFKNIFNNNLTFNENLIFDISSKLAGYKLEMHSLNILIRNPDFENDLKLIIKKLPKVLNVFHFIIESLIINESSLIDINYCKNNINQLKFHFKDFETISNEELSKYIYFIEESKLSLLLNKGLKDYLKF